MLVNPHLVILDGAVHISILTKIKMQNKGIQSYPMVQNSPIP